MEEPKTNLPDKGSRYSLKNLSFKKLKSTSFSAPQLALFVVAFGVIGYLLVKTFAAQPLLTAVQGESMVAESTSSTTSTIQVVAQAEDMKVSGTDNGKYYDPNAYPNIKPNAVKLLTNGSAAGSFSLSGAATSFKVRAKADVCNGVGAHMVVTIDGNQALSTYVTNGYWNPYSADDNLAAGSHNFKIAFTNDSTSGGCDRNLYLDKTTFLIPTSTPVSNISQVVSDPSASNGQELKIYSNGTVDGSFNLSATSTSLTVMAKADLCNGGANMVVAVDGNQVLSTTVNATALTAYSATPSLTQGSHKLTVTYNNDTQTTTCDRNLYLDVTNFYGQQVVVNPPPTVSISATPTSVTAGQSATLTWATTNATACSGSGGWSGSEPTSGSTSTGALNQSTTYTLVCTGAGGTASASASVTVSTSSGGGGGGGINSSTWAPNSGSYIFERSNFGTSASIYQDFQAREAQIGGKFDGFMTYVSCNTGASELADARSALQAGTPFVVLSWCTGNNPTTIIPSIASGSYDTDITNFANAVKSQLSSVSNSHILIRPFWEFNYSGSEWDASNYGGNYSEFGKAFTHFESIFANNNVPNVKWILNTIRIGSSSSDDPSPYYNAVVAAGGNVDWIGIDAYPKNQWLSLPTLMTTSATGFNWYAWASGLGKPLIVGETGIQPCSVYGNCNQTRATWWQTNQAQLPNYPALKAVEIFDSSTQALNWQIDQTGPTNDSGAQSLAAYTTWVKTNYFNPLGLR